MSRGIPVHVSTPKRKVFNVDVVGFGFAAYAESDGAHMARSRVNVLGGSGLPLDEVKSM